MRARRPISTLAVGVLLAGLLGSAVGADDGGSVTITDVTRGTGDSVTVVGSATFADHLESQDVGGFATGTFAVPELADALGIDLRAGTITTLPEGKGLRFVWQLGSLPAQVPPEGVRYTWAFTVEGRQYQLQAKRSNLVSSTTAEDPIGHAQQAGSDFFQLRGACATQYLGTPISGCYHLAFLEGAFDTDAGTVTIDLPYETTDAIGRLVAGDIKPGATLVANETAGMSIAASVQAFASAAQTSNAINGWKDYHVGPRVEVGVGRASGAGVRYELAELAEDGTFSVTVGGVSATSDTVHVRACSGVVCATATEPVPTS